MKLLRNTELFRGACFFAGIMCLLSLAPMPMLSFVTAVRCVAFFTAVWAIAVAVCQKAPISVLKLAAAAIFFNPFSPIFVDDVSLLRLLTVVGAVIFFAAALRLNAKCLPQSLTPSDTPEPEQ